uniref:Uncharacterized protein n=1 Tax=Loxodonta africana TaxID=9785 RepID=G3TWJ3_LOXAF
PPNSGSPSPSQALASPPRVLPSCPGRLLSTWPEHLHPGHRRAAGLPGPVSQQGSVWGQNRVKEGQGRATRDQCRVCLKFNGC